MLSAFARRRGTLEIPLFPRAPLWRHRCSFLALRQEGTECVKDAGVAILLDGTHRKKKLRSDKKNHLTACAWEELRKWKALLLPFCLVTIAIFLLSCFSSKGRVDYYSATRWNVFFILFFTELQLFIIKMIQNLPLYHSPAVFIPPLWWSHCGCTYTDARTHFVKVSSFSLVVLTLPQTFLACSSS